jgi:hypothetical protein
MSTGLGVQIILANHLALDFPLMCLSSANNDLVYYPLLYVAFI